MIKAIFLGTSSMLPTKERNPVSILLQYNSENILIDCGEGTQKQLKLANVSPTKITKILITHWHGDHIFGLPGLFQTIANSAPEKIIEIYGPINTKRFVEKLQEFFIPEERLNLKVFEILKDGTFYKNKEFELEAKKLKHSTPCLGYVFRENDKRKINLTYLKKFDLKQHPILRDLQNGKTIVYKNKKITPDKATTLKKGKKVTIILDTIYCQEAISLAKDSDLLISEATFLDNLKDKAFEYKHLTAKQAALIAKKSNSKKLALTHFSQRYKNTNEIKKEVSKIFKNTFYSKDFNSLSV